MKFIAGVLLGLLIFGQRPEPEKSIQQTEDEYEDNCEDYEGAAFDVCMQKFLEYHYGVTQEEYDKMISEPNPELANGVPGYPRYVETDDEVVTELD
jgi:hypothetical protein